MGESTNTLWGFTGARLRLMVVRGFQVLVLVVPLIFSSAIQDYGTPKLIFAEVLIIILAILWLLSMVLDGEVSIVDTPLYYAFLGLLAIGFISLFLAHNIFQGLDILFRQACFFALAVLVFHTVKTRDQIEKITGTMVLTGGIVAIIGLSQHNGIYGFGYPDRMPVSTIGNVNFIAQYYNVVFPIAVAMLFVARGLRARVGIGAACFLMTCHLVVLGSRGGWIGAVAALSLLAGMAWMRHFQAERRLVDFAIPLAIIAGLGWAVHAGGGDARAPGRDRHVGYLVDKYWDKMADRVEDAIQLEDNSSLQRVNLWRDTVRLIFDRPFLGVGLGNYEFSIPRFMSRESLAVKQRMERGGRELMAFSAHNEYLEVWAEMGLLGLLAFGILLFQIGGALVDLLRRYIRGEASFLGVGFAAAVLATLIHACFSSNLQQPASAVHFWIVVGLVWSLKLNVQRRTPLGLLPTEARKVSVGLMVLCSVMLVVALVMGTRTIVGEVYYRRGERAFRQQMYAVAEAWWREAAAHRPTRYYRIYQALGTTLYNQEKWDEAIGGFRQSLIYFPNNARVHYLLARALVKAGDADEAVAHGQQAVALNPLVADFHTGWGEALFHSERNAEAIKILEQALALHPNDAELQCLLGASHNKAGNLEAAALFYQRALRGAPDDVDILNGLAVVYSRQGNFEDARDILARVISRSPEDADYLFNFAGVQVGLGDYTDALKTLDLVLRQAPDFARAYIVQGQALALLGKADSARQAFENARRLAPNDPQLMQILEEMASGRAGSDADH